MWICLYSVKLCSHTLISCVVSYCKQAEFVGKLKKETDPDKSYML